MREIKYRAWDKKNKKMFIVRELHFFKTGELEAIVIGYTNYGEKVIKMADDIILMQYIGLKDKNKKEIYEEDIFQFGTKKEWKNGVGERGVVEWHEKLARFGLTFYSIYGGEGYTGKNQHLVDFIKGLKIIGNTYENPELVG